MIQSGWHLARATGGKGGTKVLRIQDGRGIEVKPAKSDEAREPGYYTDDWKKITVEGEDDPADDSTEAGMADKSNAAPAAEDKKLDAAAPGDDKAKASDGPAPYKLYDRVVFRVGEGDHAVEAEGTIEALGESGIKIITDNKREHNVKHGMIVRKVGKTAKALALTPLVVFSKGFVQGHVRYSPSGKVEVIPPYMEQRHPEQKRRVAVPEGHENPEEQRRRTEAEKLLERDKKRKNKETGHDPAARPEEKPEEKGDQAGGRTENGHKEGGKKQPVKKSLLVFRKSDAPGDADGSIAGYSAPLVAFMVAASADAGADAPAAPAEASGAPSAGRDIGPAEAPAPEAPAADNGKDPRIGYLRHAFHALRNLTPWGKS